MQIVDIKVQLTNMDSRLSHFKSWSKNKFHNFDVVREGDYFALEYEKAKFARLNKKSCNELQSLAPKNVKFRAYLQNDVWAQAVQSWHQSQTSTQFPVDVNIFGNLEDAEEVGRILTRSRIFLQAPRHGRNGSDYHNPQFLRLNGYSEEFIPEATPLATAGVIKIPEAMVDKEVQVDASIAIGSILNSLSHRDVLREMAVDRRIKSVLLPYVQPTHHF
jgi:SWI/SNF-related matrix-associated actin-dependent regulator of chromatin subfamily A3